MLRLQSKSTWNLFCLSSTLFIVFPLSLGWFSVGSVSCSGWSAGCSDEAGTRHFAVTCTLYLLKTIIKLSWCSWTLSQGNMLASTPRLAEGVAGVLEIESSAPSRDSLKPFVFSPLASVLPALQSSSRKVVYPYYGGSANPGLLSVVKH